MRADELDHVRRDLTAPGVSGWKLSASRRTPTRLVVFVHGFMGRPGSTWGAFPMGRAESDYWQRSDMAFARYQSTTDHLLAAADRIRTGIDVLFPEPPRALLDEWPRPEVGRYDELVLVAHSLGGLVTRHLLADLTRAWMAERDEGSDPPAPWSLDTRLRLFSPATAGVQLTNREGWLKEFRVIWRRPIERSPMYLDMISQTTALADTRRDTEALAARVGRPSPFHARTLWANPEGVVKAENYGCDRSEVAHGRTHTTVCKPDADYTHPWELIEI